MCVRKMKKMRSMWAITDKYWLCTNHVPFFPWVRYMKGPTINVTGGSRMSQTRNAESFSLVSDPICASLHSNVAKEHQNWFAHSGIYPSHPFYLLSTFVNLVHFFRTSDNLFASFPFIRTKKKVFHHFFLVSFFLFTCKWISSLSVVIVAICVATEAKKR